MNISNFTQFKVIECDDLMAIVPADQRIAQRQAIELIIAHMPTCCEYLARYTYERAQGREPTEAHRAALDGAKVLPAGGLDTARIAS